MDIKVDQLRGYKSLRAFNAFHALMLGLTMLPEYLKEGYEVFLNRVEKMPLEDQRMMIKKAATFVELSKDEVEVLLGFCIDANGAHYSADSIRKLSPTDIVEMITAVCAEIAKIKPDVTEDEKKNLKTVPSILDQPGQSTPIQA